MINIIEILISIRFKAIAIFWWWKW